MSQSEERERQKIDEKAETRAQIKSSFHVPFNYVICFLSTSCRSSSIRSIEEQGEGKETQKD
jgi:hypothetical protein